MNYYNRYVSKLLNGVVSYPRGEQVTGLTNVTFACDYGVTYRRKGDNPLIGFMEGLQCIAGNFDKQAIARVAPKANLDLFGTKSAYGVRIATQVPDVIDLLNKDPDTRQAVLILAGRFEFLSTQPCTLSMQFLTSGKLMTMIVTMRSSDAVWGLPYDLIQFSMILKCIASCTKFVPSNIIINIGHAHVYAATQSLAVNYETWDFVLPQFDTLPEWMNWALVQQAKLDMPYVKTYFGFKKRG